MSTVTFQSLYEADLAATAAARAAGIPAVVRPRPLAPNALGSYNLGACKALREARAARGLDPLTGGRR